MSGSKDETHIGVYPNGDWGICWCVADHDHALEDDER